MAQSAMRCKRFPLVLGLLVPLPCFGAALQPDTAALFKHLEPFRREPLHELSTAEYKPVQLEFLAWVDSR